MENIISIIEELRSYDTEREWFEFKENWFNANELGEYPEKEAYLFEILRHVFPTIENTPSDYQDLTFEKLIIYYGAKGLKLNLDTFKKNLSLYTEDGSQ